MEKIKELHLTDSPDKFKSLQVSHKLLFPLDTYRQRFFRTNFLTPSEESLLNYYFTLTSLYRSVEIMLKEDNIISKEIAKRLLRKISFPFPGITSLEKLKKEIQGTLLYYLKRRYAQYFLLLRFFQERRFLADDARIHIHISEEYESLVVYDFSPFNIHWHFLKKPKLKFRIFYYKFLEIFPFGKIARYFFSPPHIPPKKHKRILFAMYSYAHHHELLQKLYQTLSEISNIEVFWCLLGESQAEALPFIPEKLHKNVYLWKEFKNYDKVNFTGRIVSELIRRHPSLSGHPNGLRFQQLAFNSNYRYFNKILQSFRPDVVIHLGANAIVNKPIDHLCRYYKIPSVLIDYAFIVKNSNFLYFPAYSKHIVASEHQKQIWKALGDAGTKLLPVGFLKYENSPPIKKKKLSRTIGYAASHGLSRPKELEDLKLLLKICKKLNLKLLLKKHPFDTSQDLETLQKQHSDQMKIIRNTSLSRDFFLSIDILFSIGSSIMFDAVYYATPYAEILSDTESFSHIDMACLPENRFLLKLKQNQIESFLHSFYTRDDYREKIIRSISDLREFLVGQENNAFSEKLQRILQEILTEKAG